jgi:hypothetical protein
MKGKKLGEERENCKRQKVEGDKWIKEGSRGKEETKK